MGAGISVFGRPYQRQRLSDTSQNESSLSGSPSFGANSKPVYFGAVDSYLNALCVSSWNDIIRNYGEIKFCQDFFDLLQTDSLETYNAFFLQTSELSEPRDRNSILLLIVDFLLSIEDTSRATRDRLRELGSKHIRMGIMKCRMLVFCVIFIKVLSRATGFMDVYDTRDAWIDVMQWSVDMMYYNCPGSGTISLCQYFKLAPAFEGGHYVDGSLGTSGSECAGLSEGIYGRLSSGDQNLKDLPKGCDDSPQNHDCSEAEKTVTGLFVDEPQIQNPESDSEFVLSLNCVSCGSRSDKTDTTANSSSHSFNQHAVVFRAAAPKSSGDTALDPEAMAQEGETIRSEVLPTLLELPTNN